MKSKYEMEELCEIENFTGCLNRRTKTKHHPMRMLDGNWILALFQHTKNGQKVLTTGIQRTRFNQFQQYGIHYSIVLIQSGNPDQRGVHRKGYLKRGGCLRGDDILMSDILDEDNEYLLMNRLFVKVSITIESVFDRNRIPNFYFDYLFYGNHTNYHQLRIGWEGFDRKFLFCHLQPIVLHSKTALKLIASGDKSRKKHVMSIDVSATTKFDEMKHCLQIAHGVRLPLHGLGEIARIAKTFRMRNVIRYCEDSLIQEDTYFDVFVDPFKSAIVLNMERLVKHLLIHVNNYEYLKGVINRSNIGKMSTETKKAFISKFLSIS